MALTPSPSARSGAAQDRMLGRLLGDRYRVLSRLGEGGMGTVYLCEHAVLGRRCAIKVLRADLADDEELVERFHNEAIAASRIGGANVVDVVDFGREPDGAIYYVMEALEGRSLGAIIGERGALEVGRALAILEQICRALAAAHERGVIHRDVKPDNVFLVPQEGGGELVKVIDFGISRVTLDGKERLTRAGAIIGTPEYMAPEQAKGEPIDHRADIYALGVLAYEMLTGALPLQAETPLATLVAHQTRVPDPPSRRNRAVPPEVDALVLRALSKRPQDRPQTMAAFAAEVAALRGLAPRATTLPGTGSLPPPRSPMPRRPTAETMALPETVPSRRPRRWALAVIVGVALGVAVGAAWIAARRSDVARSGPTATATPTPTSSPTPTATSTATPTATSTATPTPTPTPTSTSTDATARPERPSKPRPAKPAPRASGTYAPGGLKPDPFSE